MSWFSISRSWKYLSLLEKFIFSARVVAEPINQNLELTFWNLWTYNLVTDEMGYVIPTRFRRNEGAEVRGAQDIAPHYLTDDRIVFSSTRQVVTQSKQLNEGRVQIYAGLEENRNVPAAALHIYDPNTGTLEQISFNQSHDLDPTQLSNGTILFSRWNNAPGNNQISLARISPTGRQMSYVYGHHSGSSETPGSTVQFTQPGEMLDGRIATVLQTFKKKRS